MDILKEYLRKFDEYPPLPYGTHYNSKKAEKKMLEAIKRNKPLTPDDFEDVRGEGIYDVDEEEDK